MAKRTSALAYLLKRLLQRTAGKEHLARAIHDAHACDAELGR